MDSKLWLADALAGPAGGRFGTVTILGGWFGVAAAILLADSRLAIGSVVSIDVDPRCEAIARSMNASHGARFAAMTADMHDVRYPASGAVAAAPDLVVNTVCEHLPDFAGWYAGLPRGQLVALQSNDYFAIPEHVNCVRDLEAFRAQAPLAELMFAGARRQKKYTRFMLVGQV
jgi:hypothetical protein